MGALTTNHARYIEKYSLVNAVEVRDVVLPDSMKRAMAGQAESERERRAKIINAEGEFQAAGREWNQISLPSSLFN